MKVCSRCNAHYEDDIYFCLQDGTPLENTDTVRISEDSPNYAGDQNQTNPSEQSFIKDYEPLDRDKSEATVVRPKPIGINIPIAEQVTPTENTAKDARHFDSSNSESKSSLKIAALASAAIFIIIAMCIALGLFDNQSILTDSEGWFDKDEDNPIVSRNKDSIPDIAETPEPTVEDQDSTTFPAENLIDNKEIEPELDDDSIFAKELLKETPAPTPKPVKEGKISGKLTFPSEGIPQNLHICVREIKKNFTACSNQPKNNFDFKVNRSAVNYSVTLPIGNYYIYATVPGQGTAYYTQFVRCGMDVKCKSHKKIPIKVTGGKTVAGIMVGDWYDY